MALFSFSIPTVAGIQIVIWADFGPMSMDSEGYRGALEEGSPNHTPKVSADPPSAFVQPTN